MGKLVTRTDNKILKRVPGNEIIVRALRFIHARALFFDQPLLGYILALQILIDGQANFHFLVRNGSQHLLDRTDKVIHQPIAKELVWHVKPYLVSFLIRKMNRLDPCFKILLSELLSEALEGVLPQKVHV